MYQLSVHQVFIGADGGGWWSCVGGPCASLVAGGVDRRKGSRPVGSEGTVDGGQRRQTRDRSYVLGRLASSGLHQAGSQKAKENDFWPALRRMGELDKTRKGRLGRDCEE